MADDQQRSFLKGSVFGHTYEISGPLAVFVMVILIALTAQGFLSYVQHTSIADAVDALVWTQLPADVREHIPPPRWVRSRLSNRPESTDRAPRSGEAEATEDFAQ